MDANKLLFDDPFQRLDGEAQPLVFYEKKQPINNPKSDELP
jgi:hypothetical protein